MKVKVLHIIQQMHSGGVEQRKLMLAQNLPKDKFEQKIICSNASPYLKEKFINAGCEVFEVGQLKHSFDLKIHKKVIKIIQEYRPHIVHGSVFEGVTLSAINGFICNVPVRIIEETSFPLTRSSRANILLKLFTLISHKIVAISPAVQEYLHNTAKIPKHKIKMIYNGVTSPIFLPHEEKLMLKKKLNINNEDYVIGSVGRMENNVKGFGELIKLFYKINQKIPSTKLLIIGGGKLLNEYKNQAKALNLSNKIIFLGYVSQVNPYYEIMDSYITLPKSEGFGLSIVEAMSHGIPVLAKNVGGIHNIIDHNINGFFIDIKKTENIISIINNLKNNIKTNNIIRHNAKEKHLQFFSQNIYLLNIEKLYLSFFNTT